VKHFCEITGKSIPTAKRAHTNLKKLEIIVEANGSYRLVNPSSDTFSEDEDDENAF
jgi:DNA-binding transcriptional regulator YhcF (GntR family)